MTNHTTELHWRTDPRPADEAAVRDIVASTGFFHDFEIDVAVELIHERLTKGLASEYHFLFADDDRGLPLGYSCFGPIACTQGSFDLYWIAVHQSAQGRGLGAALMAQTEALIAHGVPDAAGSLIRGRAIYAETAGKDLYAPTRRFYERSGYTAEARLRDFYAPGDDKVIYSKHLR